MHVRSGGLLSGLGHALAMFGLLGIAFVIGFAKVVAKNTTLKVAICGIIFGLVVAIFCPDERRRRG